MDFDLSDDQVALQAAARDLLDDRAGHDQVRAHLASGARYDEGLWRAMADQGWLGIAVPEAMGGIGLGWVEAAVLLEEVGRHTAPVPFLPNLVATSVLADLGSPERSAVEQLATGEAIGCVAWTKRPGGLAVEGSGDERRLSGRLGPVEGAAVADLAVVVADDAVYLVDLGDVGRPPAEPAMDATRVLSWLTLERTPARRVGDVELATAVLDRGAVGVSAEMLGGAGRVLEMASAYAKERVQFGQPIGSFQAVKHRCADMVVDVEGMRSATWYAAWALSAAAPDVSIAASTAKVWCSEAARRVMASGLQVHGGIGFTWEHDLHLYMKRSQYDWSNYGDAAFHRERLSGLLRERMAEGAGVF
ncbi:MAG: acyl-CoA dehydrogenase family protein [Acidimicrobiales bacterium]